MKNGAVPECQRRLAEEIVTGVVSDAEINWLPSRFPRLVMLVQPDDGGTQGTKGESIFDPGPQEAISPSRLAFKLEEKLQRFLTPERF